MRRENYSRGYYGGRSNHDGYGNSAGRSRYNDEYIYQRDYDDYDRALNNRQDSGYGSGTYAEYDSRYQPQRHNGDSRYDDGRYGNRFRDSWNRSSARDHGDRYHSDDHYGSYRNDDDRNFFQRAGDRIRDTWNNWTGNDDQDERYSHGRNSHYGDYESDRHYWNDGRSGNYRNYGGRDNVSSRRNYGDSYYGGSNERNYGGRGSQRYSGNGQHYGGNEKNYGRPGRNSYSNDYRYQNADTGRNEYADRHNSRWDADDYGERYYNGQTSGNYSSRRRSRLLEPDYAY